MTDAEVFVYTGAGGERVPCDVVRLLVNPSITSIPANAFREHKKLTEVELSEGVVEIGDGSFPWCYKSITKINIPASIRRICVMPSFARFKLLFVFTMALKVLE